MHTILVVDDEPNYLVVLSELLRDEGFEVLTADTGEKGLKIIEKTDLDLVITDMCMPGLDGLALLKAAKGFDRNLPIIMITAFGEVEKAVKAMQAGAFNYISKPFNNDELVASIKKAIEHNSLCKENLRLRSEIQSRYGFANIIGKNKQMLHIYTVIEKIAPAPSSVLITGESGTGKELVARAIHFNSPRKEAPFISLNCAGLPESLLESELFGHEKGAFTGAIALRKGRFESADKGTLFLDEIGEMPMQLQAKLLRVLQERNFERVGSSKTIAVDVRILAATNKDLKEEVARGEFREDLYYRLNVIHIHIPPLRERFDDIPMLAAHFVEKYKKRLSRPNLSIATETIRFLSTLPWDGNVRELENVIERAVLLCSGNTIQAEDVLPDSRTRIEKTGWQQEFEIDRAIPPETSLPEVLQTVEEKMIKKALEKAGNVQSHAAERLGITKSLLQYKMKKYGIKK